MRSTVTCYIVRDDLLILVPDSDESLHSLRMDMDRAPAPAGTHWIALPPGSDVTDLRQAMSDHEAEQPSKDPGPIGTVPK